MSPHPRRPWLPSLLVVVFSAGLILGWSGLIPSPLGFQPVRLWGTFRPFWETWQLVERHYVDRSAVKPETMMRGAITGLLDSLGDNEHTRFLTPKEVEHNDEELAGTMVGIGVRVTVRKEHIQVISLFPDSPAQKAGVKVGDLLLASAPRI